MLGKKSEIRLLKVKELYFSKHLMSELTEHEKQYITHILDSYMKGTYGNFKITVERIK